MELLTLIFANIGIIVQIFGAGGIVFVAAFLLWYLNRKDRENLDRRKKDLDNREDSIFERLKGEIDIYRDQLNRARVDLENALTKISEYEIEIKNYEKIVAELKIRIEVLEQYNTNTT